MKIYTKTGDKGQTSLVSGRRLDKNDVLIDTYGTVDELNSFIGDLIAHIDIEPLLAQLTAIQNTLFTIGSMLAKDNASFPDYPEITMEECIFLEKNIDQYNHVLTRMTDFILPQGSKAIAKAHICRTVTRRAERLVVSLENLPDQEIIQVYLNRLSDYFFIVARYLHHYSKIEEVKWNKNGTRI